MISDSFDEQDAKVALQSFFRYLSEKGRTSTLVRAMEADFLGCEQKPNSRRLKQLLKEMNRLLRETFTQEQRDEFQLTLTVSTGARGSGSPFQRIAMIIRRDEISTDEEFEEALSYVEGAVDIGGSNESVSRINRLLRKYEEKIAKRTGSG